jgi:HEAT repeat protein
MLIRICRSNLALTLLLSLVASLAMAKDAKQKEKLTEAIQALSTGDDAAKEAATEALAMMGADAAPAVPALTAALASESPMVRAHAAIALARIGEPARGAAANLARLIVDKNSKVRRAALLALRAIKPDRSVTLPIISKALADAEPATRIHALHSIASMGEAAMPALLKALDHPEARYWAILVIGELGPKAKLAVPQLTKLLRDESVQIRREAVMALGAIGKDAAPAVPGMIAALNDQTASVRFGAAYALGILGPDAKTAIPPLTAALNGDDEFMRVEAAWALARIKEKDPAAMDTAVKVLTAGITSKDNAVKRASVRALLDLRPGPAKVLPALKTAFDAADPTVVNEALGAIAEAGDVAIPAILAAMKIKEARGHAVVILDQMDADGPKVVEALLEALGDDRADIRAEICFALAGIGPKAAAATPALVKLLSDDSERVRYGATFALGKIGPQAKAAVPALTKALQGEDTFQRNVSAWALAHIAPENAELASQITPLLIAGLKNDQPMVREASAKALGQLGRNAAGAADALSAAAKDSDESVAAAANSALKAVNGR